MGCPIGHALTVPKLMLVIKGTCNSVIYWTASMFCSPLFFFSNRGPPRPPGPNRPHPPPPGHMYPPPRARGPPPAGYMGDPMRRPPPPGLPMYRGGPYPRGPPGPGYPGPRGYPPPPDTRMGPRPHPMARPSSAQETHKPPPVNHTGPEV